MSGKRLRHDSSGLTLIELMVWIALFTILSAIAVPSLTNVADGMRLGNSARTIERELQSARLKAVTANRPMRVRFNCPIAGSMRVLEVTGSAGVDQASDRCDPAKYPYPAADANPTTVPNHDGAVQRLDPNVAFGAIPTLEFRPDGRVFSIDGTGVATPVPTTGTSVTVTKNTQVKTITVNSLGKIQLQR